MIKYIFEINYNYIRNQLRMLGITSLDNSLSDMIQ